MDSSAWLETDEPDFIVDGLVPSSATLIIGEPMEGKSLLTIDLAAALISGEPWLGREVMGGPHRVGFVVTDPNAGLETCRRWEDRTGSTEGLPVARLDLEAGGWEAVAGQAQAAGLTVLILDNVLGSLPGDVNSARDCRALTDGLNLVLATGCAVIAVHHTAKAGEHGPGRSPLGSQHLKAWPRSVLRLFKRGGPDSRGLTTESNTAEPLDLTLAVEMTGRAARFSVLDSKDVNQEKREGTHKRTKQRLDRNAEVAAYVVSECQGLNKRQASERIAEQFGLSASTVRTDLSPTRPLGTLVRNVGGRWLLAA